MGCFTVLKSKKKKCDYPVIAKRIKPQDITPTVLPEPKTNSRSLQSAPPSFKTRTQPVQVQPVRQITKSRARALSAPSSLDVDEHDAISPTQCDEYEDSKSRICLTKEQRSPCPQPLPLPSQQSGSMLRNMGSFKSGNASGPLYASGPLPLPPLVGLRNFSFEEIASACQQFSPDRCISEGQSSVFYKASFGDETSASKKLEATVTRLLLFKQGFKEFVNEVNIIASLQHPHLCKLLGFHAREGSDQRLLVYERLAHGSLDLLLFGRSDGFHIDWCTRTKVALCAAQGLAFLHEEGPFQAMYNEFSTANIQIDKDFSAKLSGYGCVSHNPEAEISNTSPAAVNLSAETLERGLLTPKSNVWSFGVILLELLTGRKNLDNRFPKGERNLVKWSRPYLADDCRLSLIMDPRLKGRFPAVAVRTVADIALRCLQKDPSERPTMRTIVESLKNVQEMKYSCRFPLQEPATIAGKQMLRSPSLNVIHIPASRSSFSRSPSSRFRHSVSPTRRPALAMSLALTCSSTLTLENNERQESRKSVSSIVQRDGVEGF
ncbi:hypothetical protein IFM89_003476 [Coptis chinensis]|uniref:Protein kinase domain-containing protein n=1 Tax=Coptis chinensis TaxID=261450 RepID=A0A835LLB7_9MAGN|nr:hypothetical protein IFM89_003476 [Coptis chinensis]